MEIHLQMIRQTIEAAPEQEICGLIGGVWQPFPRFAIAHQVIPIKNIAENPAVRYQMEPKAQVNAMLGFEKSGWELVGIFHSHPHGPAAPSPTDLADWTYPDAVYLIGVPGGELAAWRNVGGKLMTVTLEIG